MDTSPDLLVAGAAATVAVLLVVGALARRRRPLTGSLGRLRGPQPSGQSPGGDAFGRVVSLTMGRLHPVGLVGVAVFEVDAVEGAPRSAGRVELAAVEGVLGSVAGGRGTVVSDRARFLVLLPDVTEPEACRTAEAAREAVERARIVAPGRSRSVTVSVGLAVVRREPARALQLADAALYEAQVAGGNRLAVAEVPAELRTGPRAGGPSDPPAWLRRAQA